MRTGMTTIGQWLAAAAPLPRLDCELLLAERMGVSRSHLIAFPEKIIPGDLHDRLQEGISALRGGAPLAYVLGKREFWGLELTVTPDVLIPRPETELLVETALAKLPERGRLIELGTGSGAVAIAVAHERRHASITGTDISREALAIARRNAAHHQVAVALVCCDWFAGLTGRWHVICSNPPYVADGDPHLPSLAQEPRHALVSGPRGLDALTSIAGRAREHLYPDGWLLVEHGWDQGQDVRALLTAAGFHQVQTLRDLADHERVTLAQNGTPR